MPLIIDLLSLNQETIWAGNGHLSSSPFFPCVKTFGLLHRCDAPAMNSKGNLISARNLLDQPNHSDLRLNCFLFIIIVIIMIIIIFVKMMMIKICYKL